MIAPARIAACDALAMISSGRSDLPNALAQVRSGLADERDRALAGEIVNGTLRWRNALDHLIISITGRPLVRLDREVVDILRLTIFQLLHLDRVPASAAVNDAVSLTKRAGKRSAAPLVNAVLRRVSRQEDRPALPPRPSLDLSSEGAEAYLSVTLSHPAWLVGRWLARHGFEAAEAWARFDNRPPPLMLRINRLKTDAEALTAALEAHEVRVEPARYAPDALVVTAGNPLLTPLADSGAFFVQDEASQLVALFAGAQPGEQVLDACASPGGKTVAMAAAMEDRGLLVATDVRGRRVELLARTVAVSGARCVRVIRADAQQALPFRPRFDLVLVDAPCSGLGTVRRDPDIKWRRSEADLATLAASQLQLLTRSAAVVRPGGRLVYATCSSEPEENDLVVERFLEQQPNFSAAAAQQLPVAAAAVVDGEGRLRTLPHRDGLEAFFAVTLVKSGGSR